MVTRKDFFKEFLNFFWLRPENALLLALRADAYQHSLKYFNNQKKSVDVSCGDGVFSFITFGGKLSSKTDMFRSIKTKNTFRDENYDAFDHYDKDSYIIEKSKEPDINYNFGTDWKNNLLKKASKLNFYDKLILHNNNIFKFDDNSMNYVYTNSSYWVKEFEKHINDLVRITEIGGHIVLEIKTKNIYKYNSKNYLSFMPEEFHEIIDAGRSKTWEGLKKRSEILKFLNNINNIKIKEVHPIYGNILGQIWDIGLRPLFNPLVKMANNLDVQKRISIKKEWIKIFYELFSEFISEYNTNEKEAFEFLFILEKTE